MEKYIRFRGKRNNWKWGEKTVLSKKKLIFKRDDIKQDDNKDNKIIVIPKKPFKERNKKGEDKLLKLVNEKILNYRNNKEILQ